MCVNENFVQNSIKNILKNLMKVIKFFYLFRKMSRLLTNSLNHVKS